MADADGHADISGRKLTFKATHRFVNAGRGRIHVAFCMKWRIASSLEHSILGGISATDVVGYRRISMAFLTQRVLKHFPA